MIIDYEGQSYDFDFSRIKIKQAIDIEAYLGRPFAEFGDLLDVADGKPADLQAILCLGWLVLHGGRDIAIGDTDFDLPAFMSAVADAMIAGQEPDDAAADPAADGAGDLAGAAAVR